MSRPDPIFSKTDDPSKATLPPELVGKSPEEIAAYYQRRETIIITKAREFAATPPPPPAKETVVDDKIDIYNDPTTQIKDVIDRRVNAAAEQFSKAVTPGIIQSCRIAMRDAHRDWDRWAPEVEEAMKRMTPERQMDPAMWEIAYTNVRGRHVDEISTEAVEASKRPKNPVEHPTPPGSAPAKSRELSDWEKKIAGRFELSEEQYRKQSDDYIATDGLMPFTFDSKKPRKVKAS
jgi:hypothetical protein